MAVSLKAFFEQQFGKQPTHCVKAPGRANIIGEHTDYNHGWVLPFAVQFNAAFAAIRTEDDRLMLHSLDMAQQASFSLQTDVSTSDWTRYFRSAVRTLHRNGYRVGGLQMAFQSTIPIGAGLSSSSAITCGFIALLNQIFSFKIDKERLVRLASEAENGTGVQGGMMDQYAIVMSEKRHALLLDCHTLQHQSFPNALDGYRWIFIDSHVQHNLANTEYNQRRQECEEGFALARQQFQELRSPRDLRSEHLLAMQSHPIALQRWQYVLQENERVHRMVAALQRSEIAQIGQLLYAGHEGLQHQYQVSCAELDFLVEQARHTFGVVGARMMGGGFGGGIITLVTEDYATEAPKQILAAYQQHFGRVGRAYLLDSQAGIQTSVFE